MDVPEKEYHQQLVTRNGNSATSRKETTLPFLQTCLIVPVQLLNFILFDFAGTRCALQYPNSLAVALRCPLFFCNTLVMSSFSKEFKDKSCISSTVSHRQNFSFRNFFFSMRVVCRPSQHGRGRGRRNKIFVPLYFPSSFVN